MPDGMRLNDQNVLSLIDEITGRYQEVVARCEDNRKNFFNHESKNPILPAHLGDVTPWQWDGPRYIWQKLKARLTENRVVARAHPAKDTEKWRDKSERLESVINDGYSFIEEREALDIQGYLSDGQIIDGLGVLHWVKASHLWPDADDYETSDEAEEGYELDTDTMVYRETDAAYQDRRRVTVARAGFPFYVEVIPRAQVAMVEDKTLENGWGIVVVTREVGRLQYMEDLQRRKSRYARSMQEVDPKIPVGEEKEAPARDAPSRAHWGELITIHELWTRDEYYEVIKGADGVNPSTVEMRFKHHYGMPTFAFAPGDEFNDPDPLYRFQPALEGMFRIKPALDRVVTLFLAMAEQVSLPLYYWKSTSDGAPLLREDGTMVTLSRNSLLSHKAPDGYELAEMRPEVNEAFVQGVEMLREIAKQTEADTGQADITPTSEPWNIRLQQQQANVSPSRYVTSQRNCIQTMFRNWARIMGAEPEEGGFGEPVATFKRVKGGKIDRGTTVWVEPEDIGSLDIDAHIEATSAQERITKVEHGKGLLADRLITRREFYDKYYGAENADEMIEDIDAEQLVMSILPSLLRQELMKRYGPRVVLGPDGELLSLDGQQVNPNDMLAQMGVQPGGGPAPGQIMPTQQPELPNLKSPSDQVSELQGVR